MDPSLLIVKTVKGGYHYWFALGIIVSYFIHESIYTLNQLTFYNDVEDKVAAISPLEEHKRRGQSFECDWYPDYMTDCQVMLMSRLPLRRRPDADGLIKQRWLFLGDSTMKRLFDYSILKTRLVHEPNLSFSNSKIDPCWKVLEDKGLSCNIRNGQRCQLNDMFDLPPAKEWVRPKPDKFEGPTAYGLDNPGCSDCSGCQSQFMHCEMDKPSSSTDNKYGVCDRNTLVYGGYMAIEFARDVEIQTPRYSTTQENIASYLSVTWNKPGSPLVQDWGLPICVINSGSHDAKIRRITVDAFKENVKWYLNTFRTQCSHFIWLTNTAPQHDDKSRYAQTSILMHNYDSVGVKDMVAKSRTLKSMTSIVNVFNASQTWPHSDNIHMNNDWYVRLGALFTDSFMTSYE